MEKYNINYIRELFIKKDYTLLSSEYKNKNEKLDYICNKHKELGIQQVSFASFSKNECNCEGCKKISRKNNWHKNRNFKPMSNEQFYEKHFNEYKEKIFELVGDEYTLINVFKEGNRKTFLTLKHNLCGEIFNISQYKFFKENNRCPNKICKSSRKRLQHLKSIEKVKEEIFNLVGNEYQLIGEYYGTNVNATFLHTLCGNYFNKTPHNFFAGQRCPHCLSPTKGEQRILNYLISYNFNYIFQKTYPDLKGINNGLLSYDFYMPDQNILIEYQGQFHDGSAYKNKEKFEYQQEHDKRKKEYAKSHNIKLLEIWYWDFDKIEEILDRELSNDA